MRPSFAEVPLQEGALREDAFLMRRYRGGTLPGWGAVVQNVNAFGVCAFTCGSPVLRQGSRFVRVPVTCRDGSFELC